MVEIPKEVEKLIGYSAWTALSWALRNGWVQNYKWLMSERLGRDVGVPETVDRMLAPVDNLLTNHTKSRRDYFLSTSDIMAFNVNMFADKCRGIHDWEFGYNFRNLMIEGYLLGTNFVDKGYPIVVPDKDGKDQLEGELRRHWSVFWRIKPSQVDLHRREVFNYCGYNKLREESLLLEMTFQEKLNL